MQYIFQHPTPIPWLAADLLTLLATLLVILFAVRKCRHPATVILEGFAFTVLYAGLFENLAVVNGWYAYGRSLFMFGDVPLSVPLLEMDIFITGLWLLERMNVPDWCKPFILGLFGMLQDFSLDPLAVRQTFALNGHSIGRWTWFIAPGTVNIYNIPVYNFPGWMLIMLYGSIFILAGRWLFRKSGFKPWVGYTYPFAAMILALITMVTPVSQFLLWLAPFGSKGSNTEWVMLAFHMVFPILLLVLVWRGKMKDSFVPAEDWPLVAIPVIFHLADIGWTIAGGYRDVLWLVVLASLIHTVLLAWIFLQGSKTTIVRQTGLVFSP
jgi:Protein of unknown function (DUF422).